MAERWRTPPVPALALVSLGLTLGLLACGDGGHARGSGEGGSCNSGPCPACDASCPASAAHARGSCVDGACELACDPGFSDCDGDVANGCESEAANDPHHCGACGHDCLGGHCAGGTCQPYTIPTGAANPAGNLLNLAVDETNVYFVDASGPVSKCSLSGCDEATHLTEDEFVGTERWFFAADSKVFWAGTDKSDGTGTLGIYACSTGGCAHPSLVAADDLVFETSWAMSLSPSRLVWTDRTVANGPLGVFACSTSGCAEPTDVYQGDANYAVAAVGTEGPNVYWYDSSESAHALHSCPATGCEGEPTTICGGTPDTSFIALFSYSATSASTFYFISSFAMSSAVLMACPLAGGSPTTVFDFTGLSAFWPIVDDNDVLYWYQGVPNGPFTVNKLGSDGQPITLAVEANIYALAHRGAVRNSRSQRPPTLEARRMKLQRLHALIFRRSRSELQQPRVGSMGPGSSSDGPSPHREIGKRALVLRVGRRRGSVAEASHDVCRQVGPGWRRDGGEWRQRSLETLAHPHLHHEARLPR